MENEQRGAGPGFDELLLGGVVLVMLTLIVIGLGLYMLPDEHLTIPEIQPAIRITSVEDFPIGSSRVRNWGDRVVLVVRRDRDEYFALAGRSPLEGCVLRWDPESLRVYSPCRYAVYDVRGNIVSGLTTEGLDRYSVFVRDGTVYVTDG